MKKSERKEHLMPAGVPRWVRCYDNGGESTDRYCVLFTGRRTAGRNEGVGVSMSGLPFHPQGFAQHFEFPGSMAPDTMFPRPGGDTRYGFAPAIGRKCHLGRRIPFADLPKDCRKLVLSDYRELWGLD